jgi:hypothetical protein
LWKLRKQANSKGLEDLHPKEKKCAANVGKNQCIKTNGASGVLQKKFSVGKKNDTHKTMRRNRVKIKT